MIGALIGAKLQHSISPELHQLLWPITAARFGLKDEALSYQLIPIDSEAGVKEWISQAESSGFSFANVTIPYKSVTAQLSQGRSDQVELSGAANTLRFGSGISSHNTDGLGLLASMNREWGDIDLSEFDWVVYGSGGAARGVLAEFSKHFSPDKIFIRRRATMAPGDFEQRLQERYPSAKISYVSLNGEASTQEFSVIRSKPVFHIQATPLGQFGGESWAPEASTFHADDLAVDLVYNPAMTNFLTQAAIAGTRTLSGLGMLIEQAGLSQGFGVAGEVGEVSLLTTEEYRSIVEKLKPLLR